MTSARSLGRSVCKEGEEVKRQEDGSCVSRDRETAAAGSERPCVSHNGSHFGASEVLLNHTVLLSFPRVALQPLNSA